MLKRVLQLVPNLYYHYKKVVVSHILTDCYPELDSVRGLQMLHYICLEHLGTLTDGLLFINEYL